MTNRYGLVNVADVKPNGLRTEAQMECPCDLIEEYEVDDRTGYDPRRRVVRECLECGFTEVGRYVRPATKPDAES